LVPLNGQHYGRGISVETYFEAVAHGDVACSEVDQESWHE
jgi:hypothetical protein